MLSFSLSLSRSRFSIVQGQVASCCPPPPSPSSGQILLLFSGCCGSSSRLTGSPPLFSLSLFLSIAYGRMVRRMGNSISILFIRHISHDNVFFVSKKKVEESMSIILAAFLDPALPWDASTWTKWSSLCAHTYSTENRRDGTREREEAAGGASVSFLCNRST